MAVKVLVTGAAGFIGAHLASHLTSKGHHVVGVDRLSEYYPRQLKKWRSERFNGPGTPLVVHDLAIWPLPEQLQQPFDAVVHLAAQPGVRLGFEGSDAYVRDNVGAFLNVCRLLEAYPPSMFLYASSSSVYGDLAKTPFSEEEKQLKPVSLYGATKLTNEHVASVLHRTQGIPSTGLRFFSVYGPWGRPDMAYWKIARALRRGERFPLYGDGSVARDFTYIDDVIASLSDIIGRSSMDGLPPLLNIGGQATRSLRELIDIMENRFGKSLLEEGHPPHSEDAKVTLSDPELLVSLTSSKPMTSLEAGLDVFVDWYQQEAERRDPQWSALGL